MYRLLLGSIILILISGCADATTFAQAAEIGEVGFLHGLWHGLILPLAFLCSLFSDEVAIYAIYNSGGWYDFGIFLGIGAWPMLERM